MKKPIQISIPAPCHEDWDKMTPNDKGRFCASCQKTVRDFTRASDREIFQAMQNESNTCGRFRASQLNRDLVVPKEKSKLWAAASAAAITLLTVGTSEVSAQTPVNTEHCENKTEDIKHPGNDKERANLVTGTIMDSQGMPIPGVNVKVQGGLAPGVQTDFDGQFFIEANKGEKLEITYIGMETEILVVGTNSNCGSVVLSETATGAIVVESYRTIGKPVAMVGAITTIERRRTFFGRIFHSIGNLFR